MAELNDNNPKDQDRASAFALSDEDIRVYGSEEGQKRLAFRREHKHAREFSKKISDLMVEYQCFFLASNNSIIMHDETTDIYYNVGKFYDGVHFADINAFTDEELKESIMKWGKYAG